MFWLLGLESRANAQNTPENKSSSLHAGSSKVATAPDGPLVINSDLISLAITVTDSSGRRVPGLTKDAFTVLDEKQAQEITYDIVIRRATWLSKKCNAVHEQRKSCW